MDKFSPNAVGAHGGTLMISLSLSLWVDGLDESMGLDP